jgi:hypothetical protein
MAGMFNEKLTIFRKIWQNTSESEDNTGTLYIDEIWILVYFWD